LFWSLVYWIALELNGGRLLGTWKQS